MKSKVMVITAALVLVASVVWGQDKGADAVGSPGWIVKQAFSPAPRTVNLSQYIGGELLLTEGHQPNLVDGSFVDSGAVVTCRCLETTADHATYAVFLREGPAFADMYCYLHRDTVGWQLVGIRSLAQSWVIREAIEQLKSKPVLTDSEKWDLANAELSVASDSTLKSHFQMNQAKFSEIARLVRGQQSNTAAASSHKSDSVDGTGAQEDGVPAKLSTLARQVMTTITEDAEIYSCRYGLMLQIGGILDNTVGYMLVPEGCTVPSIWHEGQRPGTGIIYIEKIAPEWYLYKTT